MTGGDRAGDVIQVGELLNMKGLDRKSYSLKFQLDHYVDARLPTRIHYSPIDLTRMAPRKPGGGGFGLSIELFSHVCVKISSLSSSEHVLVVNCHRKRVLEHYMKLFCETVKFSGSFEVMKASCDIPKGTGGGSTSSMVMGLLVGMNLLVGEPLTFDDLRILLGWNYVEEVDDGLRFGFETGVAALTAKEGGFVVISDSLVSVFVQRPFAPNHIVWLVEPKSSRRWEFEAEIDLCIGDEVTTAEDDDGGVKEKCRMVLLDLIPALHAGDTKLVGKIIRESQRVGCNAILSKRYGSGHADLMNRLCDEAEIVGISSIGPVIAVLASPDKENKVDAVIKREGGLTRSKTRVNNKPWREHIRVLPTRDP